MAGNAGHPAALRHGKGPAYQVLSLTRMAKALTVPRAVRMVPHARPAPVMNDTTHRPPEQPAAKLVCMLCPGTGSQAGGIGRFIDATVAQARAVDATIEFQVIDTRGSHSLVIAPLYFARALIQMVIVALQRRPVVFHLNVAEHGSTVRKVIAAKVAQVVRRPTIVHLHGAGYSDFYSGLPGPAQRAVRATFRRSRRIVTLGDIWKRAIVDTLEIAPDLVVAIPNGAERRRDPRPTRSGPPQILFLGRLMQRKGVAELINALATLVDLPWTATLAGDGDPAPYRAQAEDLGIADRVVFSGWVDPAAVQRLLAGASVLTLPSHAEGLPMAVIEALGAAVPVVTTPVGSLPDFLEHDGSVLFVPPGDAPALAAALRRVLSDPAVAARIAAGGAAAWERNFDIRNTTAAFLRLWHEVLG